MPGRVQRTGPVHRHGAPGAATVAVEPDQVATEAARMRAFWDARARENAMYYIHSQLDYDEVDPAAFWASGRENLDRTLAPFGLEIAQGDEVVEIGCGIGRMTRAIAERCAFVTGIDVAPEMVQRGRQALADLDNVCLLLGNGRDLGSISDHSVDVVYSFIVFQHIPDPAITCRYIGEIGRILRPGGWTVFQVSQRHEFHRRERWTGGGWKDLTRRVRRRGLAPTLAPQWLGSALGDEELHGALAGARLEVQDVIGAGTQFCVVHARRSASDEW